MSLQEGIVPVEWKVANIIPLFKKDYQCLHVCVHYETMSDVLSIWISRKHLIKFD